MGPILGAAMFGVAIGALVAGPLSDRYGRKRILLWSVALFALFSLAGAVAQSPTQLALMRFSHRPWPWRRNAQLRHAGGGIYAGAA